MFRVFIAFCLLIALGSSANTAKRVALVIGNSAYKHAGELTNPRNDATDVAATLKKSGFDVLAAIDLDKAGFDRKIRDFASALSGAEAGVFFYAGHGLQVAGRNYLVPVDAELITPEALEFEMVQLDVIQRIMERLTNTNIIFLDACRNNPLARNLARAMGTRSAEIGHGLAAVESGVGTLISFSTQPGNVALDGSGRNSPFAGALVRRISASTDDLSALLIDVRNDVRKETENKQIPWEHSALTGRFYFNLAAQTATPPQIAPAPAQSSDAAEAWDRTKDSTSIPVLELFVNSYKDTYYAGLARLRIEELKKQQEASEAANAAKKKAEEEARAKVEAERQRLAMLREQGAGAKATDTAGPVQVLRDCPDCPEMVVVPAGHFTMGSPTNEPERFDEEQLPVSIAKPFAVGRYALTRGEFAAFVAATGHGTDGGCWAYTGTAWNYQVELNWRSPGFSQNDRHPVVCVNWYDAKAYAAWLSKKTGKNYRLPSEAEREYVARAGTTTPFWWGITISTNQANYNGDYTYSGGSKGEYRKKTVPVDAFKANAWGLYNVHGNVWEWTEDCWNDKNTGNRGDGSARTSNDCSHRVVRGGSWYGIPRFLRSAHRYRYATDVRNLIVGFRVARTLNP
jgi:formylglycine-generating enzyme required for sulfatase activity